MTYLNKEHSAYDSAPIEGYIFSGAFGTLLYNNTAETHTINGMVFEPLQIERSDIEITTSLGSQTTVDIHVPSNSEIAAIYGFEKFPKDLTVQILRVHRGDDFATEWRRIWKGAGLDTSTRGVRTTIKTGNLIQSKLAGYMSLPVYQKQCNHILYDARCKVDKPSNTFTTTVTKIRLNKINVNDDQSVNGGLVGGQMVNQRTGETQTIVGNVDNEIKVYYPFTDIIIGDTVDLIRGCKHNIQDCEFTFNNLSNYGGFIHIPTVNPFEDL